MTSTPTRARRRTVTNRGRLILGEGVAGLSKRTFASCFRVDCPVDIAECAARLPSQTVMFIDVNPLTNLKLSALRLDKRRFLYFDSYDPATRDYKVIAAMMDS